MTKDDVIRLAREASHGKPFHGFFPQLDIGLLEAFAKLVAEAEKERIAKKIEQLPFGDTAQSFAIWVRNDT